jgi:hypothetical protein
VIWQRSQLIKEMAEIHPGFPQSMTGFVEYCKTMAFVPHSVPPSPLSHPSLHSELTPPELSSCCSRHLRRSSLPIQVSHDRDLCYPAVPFMEPADREEIISSSLHRKKPGNNASLLSPPILLCYSWVHVYLPARWLIRPGVPSSLFFCLLCLKLCQANSRC